jgi:hypothetical protein
VELVSSEGGNYANTKARVLGVKGGQKKSTILACQTHKMFYLKLGFNADFNQQLPKQSDFVLGIFDFPTYQSSVFLFFWS